MNRKKKIKLPRYPDRREESALFAAGYVRIAGLDEAGRGALAGPVVAAAVVIPPAVRFKWLALVRDSKLLQADVREHILKKMHGAGIQIGVGVVEASIIDEINIFNATKKAMRLAIERLVEPPDHILIDAITLPGLSIPQKSIIKGDRTCLAISCASVVAKVERDHIMLELDARYPQYGFAKHKGYGTSMHLECLHNHGASDVHRLTFGPVKDLRRLL